jgi:hypothetical protein
LPTVPHFGVQYPILPFGTPENAAPLGYMFCTKALVANHSKKLTEKLLWVGLRTKPFDDIEKVWYRIENEIYSYGWIRFVKIFLPSNFENV